MEEPVYPLTDNDGDGAEMVGLDGSGSTDSDGNIVANQWSEGTTSLGSSVNFSSSFSTGPHSVTLTVIDNAGDSSTDTAVITVITVITVNTAGASPQGSVSISGPSSLNRGDRASFTVTLTNTGSSTIAGAQLSFNVTPNSLLKNVSPGSSVAVGNLTPGSSVSQSWNVRGDNEGSGNITAGASSDAATLDTMIRSLTVIKSFLNWAGIRSAVQASRGQTQGHAPTRTGMHPLMRCERAEWRQDASLLD